MSRFNRSRNGGNSDGPAHHHTLAVLVELERECFPAFAWNPDQIAASLAAPGFHLLLIDAHGNPVQEVPNGESTAGPDCAGYLMLQAIEDEQGAPGQEILRVAIRPAHRRRGLASILLDFAERINANFNAAGQKTFPAGPAFLLLEVHAGNTPAMNLYRKHGFTEIHRRRGYYAGPAPADAIILKKECGRRADDD